jgi:hypothetical protein
MVESHGKITYDELMVLSIGVSEYDTSLNLDPISSANFDSIMVANHFQAKGFNSAHLINPTLEEIKKALANIKS